MSKTCFSFCLLRVLNSKLKVYTARYESRLRYRFMKWGKAADSHLESLPVLQKGAVRCVGRASVGAAFYELEILKLDLLSNTVLVVKFSIQERAT